MVRDRAPAGRAVLSKLREPGRAIGRRGRGRTGGLGAGFGLHRPLGVRVGINSGPVAAGVLAGSGNGPSDRPLVSGAAVNLAARLQQAAEPGEILVGETTYQLTRYAVEYAEP